MTDLTKNLVSFFLLSPTIEALIITEEKEAADHTDPEIADIFQMPLRSFVFKARKEPKASAKNLSSIFLTVGHCQEYQVCPSLGYY